MPKRPYQVGNKSPIKPDAISNDNDDNSRLIDVAAEASSSGPLPIDNVATTSAPLRGLNMPSLSISPRFSFGPTAPPTHPAIRIGHSLADASQPGSPFGTIAWPASQAPTHENRFEVQRLQAEKPYDTAEKPNEASEQDREQDTPGQIDGELPMEEHDQYEEPDNNASYLKNVLMVIDFRDAETDDAHFN